MIISLASNYAVTYNEYEVLTNILNILNALSVITGPRMVIRIRAHEVRGRRDETELGGEELQTIRLRVLYNRTSAQSKIRLLIHCYGHVVGQGESAIFAVHLVDKAIVPRSSSASNAPRSSLVPHLYGARYDRELALVHTASASDNAVHKLLGSLPSQLPQQLRFFMTKIDFIWKRKWSAMTILYFIARYSGSLSMVGEIIIISQLTPLNAWCAICKLPRWINIFLVTNWTANIFVLAMQAILLVRAY
ncbi:hypothetical protein BJ138DRAFT_1200627, partial [Hygrophoropsis aurantiaca]